MPGPHNQLVIMADEFAARALGAAGGHALTPHLDRLADGGTLFERAYTPSPMCVPARAAFQTGRPVHRLRCWDSAAPYAGTPAGWGHALGAAGHEVVSFGKLHFRSEADDNGFEHEVRPMHVLGGIGWLPGLLRREPMPFDASGFAAGVGRGGSGYSDYDRGITDDALAWMRAPQRARRPWTAFVSLVCPHYPLDAPAPWYDLYHPDRVDPPIARDTPPEHPAVHAIIDRAGYDRHFQDDRHRLRARVAYYGLCSYVDALVGELLGALEDTGQSRRTRVLFTSDHGEMLGNHCTWTKMLMYEDSVRVPLLLCGPGVPSGCRVHTPVSLLDVAPTLLGGETDPVCRELVGTDLIGLASSEARPDREAFSEYHDGWSCTGSFMLRWDRWKFVHHEGFAPQLFDLEDDPHEVHDLGERPAWGAVRRQARERLAGWCDPAQVNRAAFEDQARLIDRHGGEAALRARGDLYFDYTPLPAE